MSFILWSESCCDSVQRKKKEGARDKIGPSVTDPAGLHNNLKQERTVYRKLAPFQKDLLFRSTIIGQLLLGSSLHGVTSEKSKGGCKPNAPLRQGSKSHHPNSNTSWES